MSRRAFVTGLGAVLAAPSVAKAQLAAKKLVKIGWLAPQPPEVHSPEGQAFWQELNRMGFVLTAHVPEVLLSDERFGAINGLRARFLRPVGMAKEPP